ncbi:hypothetical protein JV197_11445, partial [Vibrio furnissii]
PWDFAPSFGASPVLRMVENGLSADVILDVSASAFFLLFLAWFIETPLYVELERRRPLLDQTSKSYSNSII